MNKHFLGIGNNSYDFAACGLSPLRCAESDIQSLAEVLHTHLNFNTQTLLGPAATKSNVEAALTCGKINHVVVQPDDFVVLMFACHGSVTNFDGSYYLHLYGASIEHAGGSMRASELAALLHGRAFKAQHVLTIYDACRSLTVQMPNTRGAIAAAHEQLSRDLGAAQTHPTRTVATLYGCAQNEVSYEDPLTLQSGVLSYFLKESAALIDTLNVWDWVSRATRRTLEWSSSTRSDSRMQRPWQSGVDYLAAIQLRAAPAPVSQPVGGASFGSTRTQAKSWESIAAKPPLPNPGMRVNKGSTLKLKALLGTMQRIGASDRFACSYATSPASHLVVLEQPLAKGNALFKAQRYFGGIRFHTRSTDYFPPLTAIDTSGGQTLVLQGNSRGEVGCCDPVTGVVVQVAALHTSHVTALAAFPGAPAAVVGFGDGVVGTWSLPGATTTAKVKVHSDLVSSLAVNHGQSRLATASYDRSVTIRALPSLEEIHRRSIHTDWIHQVAWSPDGSIILTRSADGTVKLLSAEVAEEIVTLRVRCPNAAATQYTVAAFSPDGSMLLVAGHDERVQVLNIESLVVLRSVTHGGFVSAAAWHPNSSLIASADATGKIQVFSPGGGQIYAPSGGNGIVCALHWSRDGHTLSAAIGQQIQQWALTNI